MFCLKCGARLDENATFCPSCGAAQRNSAQPTPSTRPFGTQPFGTQPTNPPARVDDGTPMKWYKFLIYFALFAGPLLNLINGIRLMSGSVYDGQEKLVYAYFDGLETLDMIVGLGMLALAALGLYTRFRLAGFYSNGPKMLLTTYAADAVLSLIYIIGFYMVMPESVTRYLNTDGMLTSYFIGIGVSVAMIFANKSYFDKRAHMFKN